MAAEVGYTRARVYVRRCHVTSKFSRPFWSMIHLFRMGRIGVGGGATLTKSSRTILDSSRTRRAPSPWMPIFLSTLPCSISANGSCVNRGNSVRDTVRIESLSRHRVDPRDTNLRNEFRALEPIVQTATSRLGSSRIAGIKERDKVTNYTLFPRKGACIIYRARIK